MDDRFTERLRRVDTPEGAILAFDCPCGENTEGLPTAIVEWSEPVLGIQYSICHVDCLTEKDEA